MSPPDAQPPPGKGQRSQNADITEAEFAVQSSNVYEADYHAVAGLKELADEYRVAIIVVHHVRKAGSDDYLDLISGSNGIAGAADAIAILTRSRGADSARLRITGRDVSDADLALGFDPDRGAWSILDGAAEDYDLADTRRRIVALLRENEGLGPKAIGDQLDLPATTVRVTLRRMAEAGQLDTDGAGHYFVPYTPVTPVTPVTPPPGESYRCYRSDTPTEGVSP